MEQIGEGSESIVPPLFVFDGGDLTSSLTVEAAELEIEGIDAPEYVGFDSRGLLLSIEGVGVKTTSRWVDVGRASITATDRSDQPELEHRLRDYLASVPKERLGVEHDVNEMSFDELVSIAAVFADPANREPGPVSRAIRRLFGSGRRDR